MAKKQIKKPSKTEEQKRLEKLAKLAKVYVGLIKKGIQSPQRSDLHKVTQLPTRFSLKEVEDHARESYPDAFFDKPLTEEDLLEFEEQTFDAVGRHKRFIVTTAVEGCPVHEGFLGAIRKYCDVNNAALIVLTCRDPAARISYTGPLLDKRLMDVGYLAYRCQLPLNNNISIQPLKTSPKQINPATGLDRIGQRKGTFIFASSKIVQQTVPMFGDESLPHVILTTGAVTLPRYETDRYMSERTAYIATFDHEIGAVLVDIENSKTYHFTQIKANPDGSFFQLGTKYKEEIKPKVFRPKALALGDIHFGETSPEAKAAFYEMAKELKPEKIILHDTLDGICANPHESHLQINMIKRAKKGQLSWAAEFDLYTKEMLELSEIASKWGGEIYVVDSNHDHFIARNIQSENPLKDPYNAETKLIVALDMIRGKNPLEEAFRRRAGGKGKNVHFLTADSSLRIEGVEVAIHGHVGPKGRKAPGLDELSKSYGPIITGHMHSPAKRKMAYRLGTLSHYRLGYNKGASDWLHTSAIINPGGTIQLVNAINGKWRMK